MNSAALWGLTQHSEKPIKLIKPEDKLYPLYTESYELSMAS